MVLSLEQESLSIKSTTIKNIKYNKIAPNIVGSYNPEDTTLTLTKGISIVNKLMCIYVHDPYNNPFLGISFYGDAFVGSPWSPTESDYYVGRVDLQSVPLEYQNLFQLTNTIFIAPKSFDSFSIGSFLGFENFYIFFFFFFFKYHNL